MVQGTRPKRILLVDDDLDFLVVTKIALEVVGAFVTASCSSAEEALRYVEEFRPDLILVDVMMPELDGIDFVQQLKAKPGFSRTPVMFMTARTKAEEVEHFRCSGALQVIFKPFDPEELVLKMNDVWKVTGEAPRRRRFLRSTVRKRHLGFESLSTTLASRRTLD